MTIKLLAATTALSIVFGAGIANAENARELSRTADSIKEQRAYQYEFDRDEQCQGYYWGVERLGMDRPCAKKEEAEVAVAEPAGYELLNEYVVYFDFDDASVRDSAQDVLRRAANDITRYNPGEVLVVGHTDTSGSVAYNEALSASRANNVSEMLTNLGVDNRVVDRKALGEMEPAVPTGDGVRLQENRRVVVKFVR